jgi:apolipoprotein D and lipocalin family protein
MGGPRLMTIVSALVAGLVAKKAKKPLATAPAVNLEQYAGTWYEIARLPEKYEKDCVSDVTATYEPTIDGGLRIINRCRRRDGSVKRAIGRAEVADADTNARLRVSFAPQLLDALPFVWSDYYIMDVASDYSMSVVGTPDRSHLWLLAREPTVTEEVRSAFIAKALGQGFDTSRLVYVRHTAEETAGGAEEAASFPGGGVEPSRPGTPASAAAPSRAPAAAETTPATDYDRLATPADEKQP